MILVEDATGRRSLRYGPYERVLKTAGYHALAVFIVIAGFLVTFAMMASAPALKSAAGLIAFAILAAASRPYILACEVWRYNEAEDDVALFRKTGNAMPLFLK